MNPQTFDEYLNEYRSCVSTHSNQTHPPLNTSDIHSFIDPETGEILTPSLSKPSLESRSQPISSENLNRLSHDSPSRKMNSFKTPFKPPFEPLLEPTTQQTTFMTPNAFSSQKESMPLSGQTSFFNLSVALKKHPLLVASFVLSLFAYGAIAAVYWSLNESIDFVHQKVSSISSDLERQSNQYLALQDEALNHIDTTGELLDELENQLDQLQHDLSQRSTKSSIDSLSDQSKQKKIHPPKTALPPVKYIGSAMNDQTHHVLIETPKGIHPFRVGDLVINEWRLSAFENKQILLTHPNGRRHVIHRQVD